MIDFNAFSDEMEKIAFVGRGALIGGAAGTGLGAGIGGLDALRKKKKDWKKHVLIGAGIGAAAGAGGGAIGGRGFKQYVEARGRKRLADAFINSPLAVGGVLQAGRKAR